MRVSIGCRSVLMAVRTFRTWDPGANLTDIMSFLVVCEHEGVSTKELAYLCGTSEATISRSVHRLAGLQGSGPPSNHMCVLRLCSHPEDSRRRAIFLTEDGRQLKHDIDALHSPQAASSERAHA